MDWVSRNLFWTSYDANKKQINVARLDGSFKNAVIQGLDKPHCLVVHPLRGYVWLDTVPAGWGGHLHGAAVLSVPSRAQETLLDRRGQHQRGQHGWQQPHSALHQPERACWYGPPRVPRCHPTLQGPENLWSPLWQPRLPTGLAACLCWVSHSVHRAIRSAGPVPPPGW